MKVVAVIFDLNGTVLDDGDENGMAFTKVLKSLGVDPKEKTPHVKGIGVEENWPILLKKYKVETNKNARELGTMTQEAYMSLLHLVKVREGFFKFTDDLKSSGIKLALATSSNWSVVEKVFDQLKLNDLFDVITTGEEVIIKKPDPQIFVLTAEKLEVEAKECVVIEDSSAGITAAKAASMKVIGIADGPRSASEIIGADIKIFSFSEMTSEKLQQP